MENKKITITISGPPGVGKTTLEEVIVWHLWDLALGRKVTSESPAPDLTVNLPMRRIREVLSDVEIEIKTTNEGA